MNEEELDQKWSGQGAMCCEEECQGCDKALDLHNTIRLNMMTFKPLLTDWGPTNVVAWMRRPTLTQNGSWSTRHVELTVSLAGTFKGNQLQIIDYMLRIVINNVIHWNTLSQ